MPARHSPLHDVIATLEPEWGSVLDMPVPRRIPGEERTLAIRLADVSCLRRLGLKGNRAEAWLTNQGMDRLPGMNEWVRTAGGLLVARLARSEFFLEDSVTGETLERLEGSLTPSSGVTPVLRQDAGLVLSGPRVYDLFTQVCNVDFRSAMAGDGTVIMTTMAGVSVLVLREDGVGDVCYRLWCDPTFAPYLWETLLEIARELGGDASSAHALSPSLIGLSS